MWISAEISSWRKLAPQLPQSAVLSSSEQSDVPHPSGKTRLLHSNPAPACCSGAPGWLLWELYIANHWSYFLIWFSLMWSKSVWLCSCCGWWLVCWFYLHFWHSRCVCLGSCSTQELRGLRAIPSKREEGERREALPLAHLFVILLHWNSPLKSHVKEMLVPGANNWLFWFYREVRDSDDIRHYFITKHRQNFFLFLFWSENTFLKLAFPLFCLTTARYSAILAKLMAAKWPYFQQ